MIAGTSDEKLAFALARHSIEQNRFEEALEALKPHTASPEAPPQLLWLSSLITRHLKQAVPSIEYLERTIRAVPSFNQPYIELSNLLCSLGLYHRALSVLQNGYEKTACSRVLAEKHLIDITVFNDTQSVKTFLASSKYREVAGEYPHLELYLAMKEMDWELALDKTLAYLNLQKKQGHLPPFTGTPPQKKGKQSDRLLSFTLGTSLSPRGGDEQIAAMSSWHGIADKIISVNTADEISMLSDDFPFVHFCECSETINLPLGKRLTYIDDILEALSTSKSDLHAIVNGDIQLLQPKQLLKELTVIGTSGLTIMHRSNMTDTETLPIAQYRDGFDAFFFAPHMTPLFKKTCMQLGSPWWDYLFPLLALRSNYPIHIPSSLSIGHVVHSENWSNDTLWRALDIWLDSLLSEFPPTLHTNKIYEIFVYPLLHTIRGALHNTHEVQQKEAILNVRRVVLIITNFIRFQSVSPPCLQGTQ